MGKPGDVYEQEADRVAEQVISSPEGSLQRQPIEEEEEELQPKMKSADGMITHILQRQPLEEEEEEMQPKMKDGFQIPFLQRQPIEEEEELLQPKMTNGVDLPILQRQPIEEEEELLQPKMKNDMSLPILQRQPIEEAEELLQPKMMNGLHQTILQRQSEEEEEEYAQMSTNSSTAAFSNPHLSRSVGKITSRNSGSPFATPERKFFEPRLGHDFTNVRIHTNQQGADMAQSVNARAFTVGRDIVFGPGEYAPSTPEGQRLIAHELTHVIQQSADSGPLNLSEDRIQRGPPSTAGGSARPREVVRDRRTPASSIGDYITLVRSLEVAYPELDSRQLLAMLRQIYYGRPWSARPTAQWSDVLPNSPAMSDPRHRAGRGAGSLFHSLRESQEFGGLDIGHVLTGLEALLNPTTAVTLSVTGPDPTVAMPNTEFATWGGDLGSAAGQCVADILLTRTVRSNVAYFREYASNADLEGNIDSFGIAEGARSSGGLASLLSAPPSGSMAGAVRGGTPVSQILSQYYTGTTSALSRAHTNRHRNFVTRIGGRVSGNRIVNRTSIVGPIAGRVASFARLWFIREVRDERGIIGAAAEHFFPAANLQSHLNIKSRAMVNLFLTWLEARL